MNDFSFHVDDIYAMRDKKMEESITYQRMLEEIYKRVMMIEKKGISDMIYEVEPFIVGMPLYSKEYAINYIIQHMTQSGFKCTYMGESYIYITWGLRKKFSPNRKEIHADKRRQDEIKRTVSAPEYKQNRPTTQHGILPSNAHNVSVHIKNPNEFLHSVQMDKHVFQSKISKNFVTPQNKYNTNNSTEMNKRNRTFSDVSIAESCIDVYTKSSCLLKHPPATDYLSQQDVSAITLYINSHYSNFNTSNILYVSKGLYTHIQDVYKIKKHDQLKIICRINFFHFG